MSTHQQEKTEQVVNDDGLVLTYTPYKNQCTSTFLNDCIANAMPFVCHGLEKKEMVLKAVRQVVDQRQGDLYLVSSFEKYNNEALSNHIDCLVAKQKGKDLAPYILGSDYKDILEKVSKLNKKNKI